MNNNKLLEKYANITTFDGKKYKIRTKNYYISKSNFGEVLVVKAKDSTNKNLYILKEVYSLDDNRLRFLCDIYKNVNTFSTIEKNINGDEKNIIVLNDYQDYKERIMSIGNIKSIKTDLINIEEKSKFKLLKKKKGTK